MNLQTVRKVVTVGFTMSIIACLLGLFAGADNPTVNSYAIVGAVLFLLFSLSVLLKWGHCPWCGASLLRGFFKHKVCPKCHRDLVTGKKKKGKGGRK